MEVNFLARNGLQPLPRPGQGYYHSDGNKMLGNGEPRICDRFEGATTCEILWEIRLPTSRALYDRYCTRGGGNRMSSKFLRCVVARNCLSRQDIAYSSNGLEPTLTVHLTRPDPICPLEDVTTRVVL